MLAVDRAARGRGAGESLVRACVDRARATPGCTAVVLSTQRTMHAAHRIYGRLGFVRAPERDWNPIPDLDDITLLTYELTL
jgi:ribosomal protein S18 acetylase RimI-like enzyme